MKKKAKVPLIRTEGVKIVSSENVKVVEQFISNENNEAGIKSFHVLAPTDKRFKKIRILKMEDEPKIINPDDVVFVITGNCKPQLNKKK